MPQTRKDVGAIATQAISRPVDADSATPKRMASQEESRLLRGADGAFDARRVSVDRRCPHLVDIFPA